MPTQGALQKLVGESPAMRLVKERIAKVARSMAPVIVRGESGTGKELVARAIHACSHRAEGPFIAVNCSAIPETLLEAEFFGAKKGSYTGATADREGYFQAARGGTLFLDEIGDLPLPMQSKLLRAIQERQVRSLGSTQEDTVDVRVVSATHRDLAADVQAGRFRQDLFYRLNVIEIVVPPLRERREDLPALCEALLARIAQESGMPTPQLSPAVMEQLMAHPLTGNVRELENLLHRAVALSEGEELQVDFAPTAAPGATDAPAPLAATGMPQDLQSWLDQQERAILVKALRETGYNRTAAAQKLGLSLRQIRYRIARLAIVMPGGTNDDGNDDA
jgi:two-component system response regulator PilR (NtrC family)